MNSRRTAPLSVGPAHPRRVVLGLVLLTGILGAVATMAEITDRDQAEARTAGPPNATPAAPAPPHSIPSPGKGIGLTPRSASAPRNVYSATASRHISASVAGIPERVYVPNSESASVDVIDPRTFRVVAHYTVGRYPEHVTPSWDLRRLYVDNTYGNSLTVVDPRTGMPTGKTIHVSDPYNLYFTPDGSKAIVVAERFRRLDIRNPRTFRLIKSIPITAAGPDHLDFSADGRFFLISCEFSGLVFRVDMRSMRVTGEIRVGGQPVDVKLSPGGRLFYVANQSSGGVSVIDPSRMKVVGFIPTGRGAHGLAVSRDAQDLYVSNRLSGSVSLIRFATHRVVATWHVGGSPDMLQVSPDGKQLWASNRFNASVFAIDTTTGQVLHTIPVGGSPHGLSLFPQPGRYSLGHNGVYR